MQRIRHLYKFPHRLTKKIKLGEEAAYNYELYEYQAKNLPQHYVRRCIEFHETKPRPIHYIEEPGRWKLVKGRKVPVQNFAIPITFPEEANHGLWGGEGVVEGYVKKDRRDNKETPLISRIWKPLLMKRALYSELLDQWYQVTVTLTTLDDIDECMGFDNYILQTKERHINSRLGILFRREMLLALARQNFYPEDEKKKKRILAKYQRFIIPEEEAEWVGLTVNQALKKAEVIKEEKRIVLPMKMQLSQQLVQTLKGGGEEDEDDNDDDEAFPSGKELKKESRVAKFLKNKDSLLKGLSAGLGKKETKSDSKR